MKLFAGLMLTIVAAAAVAGCGKSEKAPPARQTPAARPTRPRPPSAPAQPPARLPEDPSAPAAPPPAAGPMVVEAATTLAAALAPIADNIEAATTQGCALGTDRVTALYAKADGAAAQLHVLLRDPAVRAQLAAAVHSRTDPALARVLSKIDTALIGCQGAAGAARNGLEQLLQPSVALP